MSTTRLCEACEGEFTPHRANVRFCLVKECQDKRRKARWEKWRDAREAEGTFRDIANAQQRSFRQRTGYARDYELRTKYGITLDQWVAMVDAAGGVCEICGEADEALCVDHDHETGQVRGVLCRRCNRALGQLGDTAERLRKAWEYLLRAREANRG